MKSKLLLIYTWLVRMSLFFFPDAPCIMRFRGWLYGLVMMKCGKNFQIAHDARITGLEKIAIGNDCFIGNLTILFAGGEIRLEDEVMIAPLSVLVSDNHVFLNGSYRFAPVALGPIRICKGAWISANCTVTKDAVLPAGSVLGANSILNASFEIPNSLYAGTPAKFIKKVGSVGSY